MKKGTIWPVFIIFADGWGYGQERVLWFEHLNMIIKNEKIWALKMNIASLIIVEI